MEKLYRDSDGFYRTVSGSETGVTMRRVSKKLENGVRIFEFHPQATAPLMRIEWDGDVAVLPNDIANLLLTNRYASNITELHAEAWNQVADEWAEKKAEADAKRKEEEEAEKARKAAEPPPPPPAKPTAAPVPTAKEVAPPAPAPKPVQDDEKKDEVKGEEPKAEEKKPNVPTPLVPPKKKAEAKEEDDAKAKALAKAEAEAAAAAKAKKSDE